MPPVDLLSWPDLRDAEQASAQARLAWREAQRPYWIAPHGQRESRLCALKEASQTALRAEAEVARLRGLA